MGSKGESIIGTFNSTGDPKVEALKKKAAELVDLIEEIDGCPRRKAIAITNIETGLMFAVKAMFHK